MNEIYDKIEKFLNENKNGYVDLVYPDLFNTGGIRIGRNTFKNENKLQFGKNGIMIFQALGNSMITGKHLYLPYGNCAFVFIENEDDI